MAEPLRSVLVVDDDESVLRAFHGYLSRRGIASHLATNRDEGLELARRHQPQVGFLDLKLGYDDDGGLKLLSDLRTSFPAMRLMLITGYGSIACAVKAMKLGAIDVLTKPFEVSEAMARLKPSNKDESLVVATPSADRALWEHVHRVLGDCQGNKSEAARRLGKPRSWLRRFLSKPPPNELTT